MEEKTLRTEGYITGLGKINQHIMDQFVHFDEGPHTYTVDNYDIPFISGTSITHHYFPSFIPEDAIKGIINGKRHVSDNTYEYYKKTADEIKEMWTESNLAGTKLHLNIEYYLNKLPVVNNSIEYQMFLNFANEHNILNTIYRTEWIIYSPEHQIAGSIDAIIKNPDGTFTILDWKRTKDIKFINKYQKFYKPFEHLSNCNFNHYAFQLNLYRAILQKVYGLKISSLSSKSEEL